MLDLFSVTNIAQVSDLFVSMNTEMQGINLEKLSLLLVLLLPWSKITFPTGFKRLNREWVCFHVQIKINLRALHFQVQNGKKIKVFVFYAPLYNTENGFWISLPFSVIAVLTPLWVKGLGRDYGHDYVNFMIMPHKCQLCEKKPQCFCFLCFSVIPFSPSNS